VRQELSAADVGSSPLVAIGPRVDGPRGATADGEEAVAARLRKLGDRWKVLHAIPVGENGSDIDHVVIGPGGLFTINTKHHPNSAVWVGGNTFMVDGQQVP
jgi:hypothetical protein